MRYLGLDLGTKTLGVSISDQTNTLVSPLVLIKFREQDYHKAAEELLNIAKEKNISSVILGLPKNMDNSLGFAAKRSLNFKNILEQLGLKVILVDERLTSIEAENIMKRNGVKKINKQGKTDIIAAVLILESFLKRMNNEKK